VRGLTESMVVSTQWEGTSLHAVEKRERFEQALLPHLDAAFNLARWLTHDDHDAEDLVQVAYLRALKSVGGFHGANSRAWLLTIVRNACYTWLEQERTRGPATAFDEQIHGIESHALDPEKRLLRAEDQQLVRRTVEQLPLELREVLVLRELEGLSYKEIAAIAGIPMGTVMSRLARARERLHQRLGGGGDWGS
jgi:RNA polymerase sigma-70 factor, ECF subfamily